MKRLNSKISVITNVILCIVLISVFVIGFAPQKVEPSYGGVGVFPIYNGNTEKKQVSIMVNVYENTNIVNEMVGVFNSFNAKATFFVGGCWADDNQETLKMIVENGHEIGNHGYFHKDHKKLSYQENEQEIKLTGIVVSALSGFTPTLFAPPSGSFSNTTLEVAEKLGYKVIMWSKDTIDWRDSDTSKLYNRATSSAKNGDLILMHPKPQSIKVLPDILKFYIDNGFGVVTVSKNISKKDKIWQYSKPLIMD